MNRFPIHDDAMFCEGVSLKRIAEEVSTPVYVYSAAALKENFTRFQAPFLARDALIAYAVKANSNLSVLRTLAQQGAGADTVSEGEVRRALAAGIPADRIIFSGVGKSRSELSNVVKEKIYQINVESEPELDLLESVAAELNLQATIAIRINPDVSTGTHQKISTGKAENKFGVSLTEAARLYRKATASAWLRPVGLACHIGSQIVELTPFRVAYQKLISLARELISGGMQVERLDFGGGLGVSYDENPAPEPHDYAALVFELLGDLDVRLIFEPGRYIAANSGVLLSRVVHVHARPEGVRFLVLDAAMNDFMRPALYDAFHSLEPVLAQRGSEYVDYDIVGPVCETGDTFGKNRRLPTFRSDDLVVFRMAGAYGASMSSQYNTRPLVPEVLVDGSEYAVVRRRPTYAEMLQDEPIAPWHSDRLQPSEPISILAHKRR